MYAGLAAGLRFGLRAGIEQLRALPHDDADIGQRAAHAEVRIVRGHPVEEFVGSLLPAAVDLEAFVATDEVAVGDDAAGQRFVEPHAQLVG